MPTMCPKHVKKCTQQTWNNLVHILAKTKCAVQNSIGAFHQARCFTGPQLPTPQHTQREGLQIRGSAQQL